MKYKQAFLAFLRWVIFGVANSNSNLFIDVHKNDLVIHAFLVNRQPPIHREQRIPEAFGGLDEVADFVRVAKGSKNRDKLQSLADRHLVQGLLLQVGCEEKVAYGAKLYTASGEELTDLDAYIPSKKAWIELTTSRDTNKHFFEKLGRFAFIGRNFSIKEKDENDPERLLEIAAAELEKMFYLSLYPITYSPDPKAVVSYKVVHVFKDSDVNKVTEFLVGDYFMERAKEKFNEIVKALKSFLEI